jgi:hypothetical protein
MATIGIEKRIRALEVKTFADPIILHFADGTTREICGPRYFLPELFARVFGGELNPTQASYLELIRRSTWATEPGGGRIVELIRALDGDIYHPEIAENG